jgi:hypothetical protein
VFSAPGDADANLALQSVCLGVQIDWTSPSIQRGRDGKPNVFSRDGCAQCGITCTMNVLQQGKDPRTLSYRGVRVSRCVRAQARREGAASRYI